jgi:hypothetical protein
VIFALVYLAIGGAHAAAYLDGFYDDEDLGVILCATLTLIVAWPIFDIIAWWRRR